MDSELSPRFLKALQATLHYWLAQTAVLDDAAIHQLNPEFPNLLRVVKTGIMLPETWRETADLILQVFFWIEGANYIGQWQPVVAKCLHHMPTNESDHHFRLLKQLGQLQRLHWELETAVNTFKQAHLLAHQTQNNSAIAEIHMNLCETYRCQQRYELAEGEGHIALSLFSNNTHHLQAITWQSLGHIAKEQGNLSLAETRFQHALNLSQDDAPSVIHQTRTLAALASVYQAQTRHEQALQLYQQIASLLVNTSHAKDQIENQINQGTLFYNWGKLDNAYAAFKAAEHMLRSQAGLMLHKAVVANNMATVWRDRQEWVAAESYYQQSIRFYHQIGNQLQLARTMINLAKCHIQQKAPVAALAQLEKAHDLLEQTPYNKQVQLLRKEIAAQLTHLEPAKKSDKTASLPLSAPSAAT